MSEQRVPVMEEPKSAESLAERMAVFVTGVFQTAKLHLHATVQQGDGEFRVILTGEDVYLLLAKNAELLNAVEYLAQRVFLRQAEGPARITFDAAGYRSLREAELRLMAQKAAERVKNSKSPFVFDPMSPGERRIIHLALVGDAFVKTESQGDGYNRKVVILPAT